MARFKIFGIVMFIVLGAAMVIGGKVKTGEFKSGVFTDTKLGYAVNIPDNWKVKILDEPSNERLLLIKRNYEVNRKVRDLGGEFTIPEFRIFARPDSMSAEAFLEKVKSEVLTHKSADDIISQLDLINSGEYSLMQQTLIDSTPAVFALFKKNYQRKLEVDPNDSRYRQYGGLLVENEHIVNEIFIFKHKDNLFLIQAFAEREFYPMNKEEFRKIIASLKFADLSPAVPGTEPSPGK
jgi:hypothetical protein